jgi:hypothetical protein
MEQCLKSAFGPLLPYIGSVQSDEWYVNFERPMSYTQYLKLLSRPLSFGKTYIITLRERANTIQNFQWTDSRTRPESGLVRPGEIFVFEKKRNYEVIDVLDLNIPTDRISEIGVFVGDNCIGSAIVDSFPLQILIYPEGFEGRQLTFKALYERGRVTDLDSTLDVFEDSSGRFIETILIAGETRHAITRMTYGRGGENQDESEDIIDHGAYPNPFNPETIIRFTLPEAVHINVEIFNIRGQRVSSLINDVLSEGHHSIIWNGTDESNRSVSSGIYFYRISTSNNQATGRIVLMK